MRRERGLRAIVTAPKALAVEAAGENGPRASAKAAGTRGVAIAEAYRRNRSWTGDKAANRDAAWFNREVLPKLDAIPLSAIAQATGLWLTARSRIRAGTRVPRGIGSFWLDR